MKWFLALVVILNLLVAGYGLFKQHPSSDIHAQEISPEQVKLLPPDWIPASAPAVVAAQPASAPATEPLHAAAKAASVPVADKPSKAALAQAKPAQPAKPEAVTPAVEAKPKPAAKPVACYNWGVLDGKLLARVKGGLPGLKLKPEQLVETAKGESKGTGKFWVYYPALATKAETQTLAAELKDKGFDNYMVNNAEFKGTLSLGLFGKEEGAKALVAKIKAAGFDKVNMQQKGKTTESSLLTFKGLDDAQVSKLQALQKRLTPGIALKSCQP